MGHLEYITNIHRIISIQPSISLFKLCVQVSQLTGLHPIEIFLQVKNIENAKG